MKQVELMISLNQPELADYEALYPRSPCNTPQKEAIFKLITLPTHINEAITIAEGTGNSPVSVFETKISGAIESGEIDPLSSHEKQFVGTVTALIMGLNGWGKTGRKQRFTKGIFKSAEIYSKESSGA
jgi:hypothetical protein